MIERDDEDNGLTVSRMMPNTMLAEGLFLGLQILKLSKYAIVTKTVNGIK